MKMGGNSGGTAAWGPGPSHRSQFNSGGWRRRREWDAGMPRAEIGGRRFDPACTSRTVPSAPDCMYSQINRARSPAWPWLPICVATPVSLATSPIIRASSTEWVSGFWQWTCLPIFMAIIETTAWL